jgi:hypothetical protein
MSTPRLVPGDRRVKTAWTDPEHVRLAEGTPEERVSPHHAERLRRADLDDWVAPCPHAAEEAALALPAGGES